MSQGGRGIEILFLSLLAALGLLAFTAAAAQAGEFKLENNNTFTSKGIASETFEGTIAEGELLLPTIAVTLRCIGGTFSGTALLGGVAHVTALFSGCEILNSGGLCKPFETKAKMEGNLATDKGFIAASGLAELLLMGGQHYLLVSSSNFTTLYMPKLCSASLETVIPGSFVLAFPQALTPSVSQTVNTISQAELESLWPLDRIICAGGGAWLDGGSASVTLSGPNKGQNWGAE